MNKTKLMLPLAALLMMPAIVGCGNRGVYQGIFNNDQIICTHGTQIIDVTLETHVKSKLHFKNDLTPEMFEMPSGYTTKTIEHAVPYNSGSSLFLILDGDLSNPAGGSTTLDIGVKKDAFKEPSLGGKITVSLFPNQIRRGDGELYKVTEDNTNDILTWVMNVETIGADFICPEHNTSSDANKCFEITAKNGDTPFTVSNYTVDVYEQQDGSDLIYIEAKCAKDSITDNAVFTLKVNDIATTLGDGYICEIMSNSQDPALFKQP